MAGPSPAVPPPRGGRSGPGGLAGAALLVGFALALSGCGGPKPAALIPGFSEIVEVNGTDTFIHVWEKARLSDQRRDLNVEVFFSPVCRLAQGDLQRGALASAAAWWAKMAPPCLGKLEASCSTCSRSISRFTCEMAPEVAQQETEAFIGAVRKVSARDVLMTNGVRPYGPDAPWSDLGYHGDVPLADPERKYGRHRPSTAVVVGGFEHAAKGDRDGESGAGILHLAAVVERSATCNMLVPAPERKWAFYRVLQEKQAEAWKALLPDTFRVKASCGPSFGQDFQLIASASLSPVGAEKAFADFVAAASSEGEGTRHLNPDVRMGDWKKNWRWRVLTAPAEAVLPSD